MNDPGFTFTISDSDKVSIALLYLLRSDDLLMQWSGGYIQRTGSSMPILEMPPPQILVVPLNENELFQPSGKVRLTMPQGILLFWEETRRVLEDDEPTIVSVVSHIKSLLLNNYYLNGPPFNERLTRRLDQFQVVDYAAELLGGGGLLRYIVLGVDYEVDVAARTRKVAC